MNSPWKLVLMLALSMSSPAYAGDFGSPLPPETYTDWLSASRDKIVSTGGADIKSLFSAKNSYACDFRIDAKGQPFNLEDRHKGCSDEDKKKAREIILKSSPFPISPDPNVDKMMVLFSDDVKTYHLNKSKEDIEYDKAHTSEKPTGAP